MQFLQPNAVIKSEWTRNWLWIQTFITILQYWFELQFFDRILFQHEVQNCKIELKHENKIIDEITNEQENTTNENKSLLKIL